MDRLQGWDVTGTTEHDARSWTLAARLREPGSIDKTKGQNRNDARHCTAHILPPFARLTLAYGTNTGPLPLVSTIMFDPSVFITQTFPPQLNAIFRPSGLNATAFVSIGGGGGVNRHPAPLLLLTIPLTMDI